MRTRIKFCGFTRDIDIQAATRLGVDALGFVFYAPSPRCVSPIQVASMLQSIPAFISTVGLFVNASLDEIAQTLSVAPVSAVQLHGDESWAFALTVKNALQKPVIKAVRVNDSTDWDEIAHHAHTVSGVLLDTDSVDYGGTGHTFDWNLIPTQLHHKIILSGGLNLDNIAQALQKVKPYALDVSSGIEAGTKGVKDVSKMTAFVQAVKNC